MERLAAFCAERYRGNPKISASVQEHILDLWRQFEPLADPIFCEELCSKDEGKFDQRYWEMLLAHHLTRVAFTVSSDDEGPDFKAIKDQREVWVEAVAPTPGEGANRLPTDYLTPDHSKGITVVTVPHEAILLRWTTAILKKHAVYEGYVAQGIVGDADPYVIAVNSCMLGSEGFTGISQLPNAVEATFAVGPQQVTIERETLRRTGWRHQYRPGVMNANLSDVPTHLFLNPAFAGISAIVAAHVSPDICAPESALAGKYPFVVVHNPLAQNPVPERWFGGQLDYVAQEDGAEYKLRRIES